MPAKLYAADLADDLEQFTLDGEFPPGNDPNTCTLFTQRDKVHPALKWLIEHATHSVVLTMYGYDDEELDDLIREKLESKTVYVQLSLDRTQAAGKAEHEILAKWEHDAISNSVAIGTAESGAIAHMKAGVIDGLDVFDGSTNWSKSGEGEAGARAQNNSLVVMRSHAIAVQYRARLDTDHDLMLKQMARRAAHAST